MELLEDERIDDLGRRGYRIIQNRKKFCFGIDATFLAWFARVKPGERVMDLCSGTGIVPLLMDARNACGDYTGLEIDPEMVEMAGRSAELNGVSGHMRFVSGDVKTATALFGKGVADVVTVNPPYMPAENGLLNLDAKKAAARHEVLCTLEDVVREAAGLLVPGGRFYMVHRPMRLPEIFENMRKEKLSPERIAYIHPFADKEATMVLVSGIKGGHSLLKAEPPVIIYREPNVYTERVLEIYNG